MYSHIKPLTQDERLHALSAAQQAVVQAVGDRPQRDQFNQLFGFKASRTV